MNEVSLEEIYNKLDELKIIDIRDNYRYIIESIPNSINVPMNFLLMNPNCYLNKDDTYYILCEFGNNSKIVSDRLNKMGFNTFSVNGGFNGYKLLSHLK